MSSQVAVGPFRSASGRSVVAALRQDSTTFGLHGRHSLSFYLPIPILPPDQYGALVVQLTEGCSYNQCTFCRFYRDGPFRCKSSEELRRYIRAVREFFGEGLHLRRSVFLAAAGLRRLYLGLESGCDDLLRFLNTKEIVAIKGACSFSDLPPRSLAPPFHPSENFSPIRPDHNLPKRFFHYFTASWKISKI